MRMLLSAALVLLVACATLHAGAVPTASGPSDHLWLFNFAPEASRDLEGFIKVSSSTTYDPKKGFGWLDLQGKVATGTLGDPALPWEACDNLNLITRSYPDDLGRTFAAGPASFVVDLPSGKYDLWFLVGDTGYLDYIPYEPFSILVGKSTVFKYAPKASEFYDAYEAVPPDDTISEWEAYVRYVKPRFQWVRAEVNVTDNRLTIHLDSAERTAGTLPTPEFSLGPSKRFAGSLCALMLSTHVTDDKIGTGRIEMLEAFRRENFRRRYPRLYTDVPEPKLDKADLRRGYTLFFPDLSEDIAPGTFRPNVDKPVITLRATPGEAVPMTFALYATDDIRKLSVSPGYLRYKIDYIQPRAFDVTQVRYVASVVEKLPDSGFKWQPVPCQLVPVTDDPLPKGSTRQFWLTLNIPEKTKPGTYTGKISVTPLGAPAFSIDLSLEVLPDTPKHPEKTDVIAYVLPIPESYFGEKRLWERVRADLTDLRAHGFTSVALLPTDNKDIADKFAAICGDLGLKQAAAANASMAFHAYTGLPNDFFDAGGQLSRLTYPSGMFSIISTLQYERLRRGLKNLLPPESDKRK